MNTLFANIINELKEGRPLVLAGILTSEGSSPRGAGSLMLVGERGRIRGSVGGGAVEKLCQEEARDCLDRRCSGERRFGLRQDGPDSTGMACGGEVAVWFQFIDPAQREWRELSEAVLRMAAEHRAGWLVLKLDGSVPALLDGEGRLIFGSCREPAPELAEERCVKTDACFYLPLHVRERAVIFGGGHCAQALAPVLSKVGFRVTVFDCRPEFSMPELFPEAETVICGDYLNIAASVTITASDYVVIMTNGHSHDLEVERQVLQTPAAYVGVIGSRNKAAFISRKLKEEGVPDEALSRVHSPIGTAIKADTPEEIAISIAGEMIYERALLRETRGSRPHRCPMR
ncbi:MAG: XdhC family protein [Oscillospiraceae bacterium]|nr:XdhC family protein [Oscillospiraceae bacterium]